MSWADRKKGIELRTLLTTSHSLVLGLGILLVGLGVFKALSMHTNMHNTMEMKRALLYGIKDVLGSSGEEGLRPNRATISCPAGLAERANALTARIANAGRFVVIYDENDNIIAEEYPKRFKGSLPDRLPSPYKTWRFGKGPDSWQAVALPVQSGGERYTVVVGIMWFPYEILIFHIARGQLFIFALTMLLGLIASRVVASQISKPVEDLAEVARKVSQGDLSQRSKGSTSPRELAQLSRDFNGMLTQLEGSFEAQQRFIADASHELKSPLTSISGMAELLRRGALKRAEDTEMVVSTIEREVDRMDRLVNDLLDLSEAEHQATKLVPVELASLFLEFSEEVTVECPPDLCALADPDSLRRVVRNLLDNAIKYSDPESPVWLTARAEGNRTLIRVVDQGIGIPQESIDKIFQRFYRADPARARKTGGSGLGLAIVKALVESMGGKVSMESEQGQGTTAEIALARVRPS